MSVSILDTDDPYTPKEFMKYFFHVFLKEATWSKDGLSVTFMVNPVFQMWTPKTRLFATSREYTYDNYIIGREKEIEEDYGCSFKFRFAGQAKEYITLCFETKEDRLYFLMLLHAPYSIMENIIKLENNDEAF